MVNETPKARILFNGHGKATTGKAAPNEVPQLDLLQRDVGILFEEVRRLRRENEQLLKANQSLAIENNKLKDVSEVVKLKKELKALKKADETEQKQDLAFYIRAQREALGISRGEMSRRLNMVDQTLANYEKGKGSVEGMQEVADKIREMRRAK